MPFLSCSRTSRTRAKSATFPSCKCGHQMHMFVDADGEQISYSQNSSGLIPRSTELVRSCQPSISTSWLSLRTYTYSAVSGIFMESICLRKGSSGLHFIRTVQLANAEISWVWDKTGQGSIIRPIPLFTMFRNRHFIAIVHSSHGIDIPQPHLQMVCTSAKSIPEFFPQFSNHKICDFTHFSTIW